MNLDLINANVTRLLRNIGNVISFLKEYTVDESKDVSITHIGDDGSEITRTFPNITKQINSLNARSSMVRTVYVDQANGNDDNTGFTRATAFQSLQKAFSTIPIGGQGHIHIIGVYNLGYEQVFTESNKIIRLYIGPDAQLRNEVGPLNAYAVQGGVIIDSGTSLTVRIFNNNDNTDRQLTKIYSPANTTGRNYRPTHAGFFGFPSGPFGGFAKLTILTRIRDPDTEIVKLEDGYLFWRRNWDPQRLINPSLTITGHNTGKYVIGQKLVDFDLCPAMFNVSATGTSFVDLEGNTIRSFSDIVDGITRDSNGIPRNISSNIIF